MVGFLLGERFTLPVVRQYGRLVLWFSVGQVIGTALVVFSGMFMLGFSPVMALLLAGIAPATDPMATTDVVNETRTREPLTSTLLGVVAVDDAWGLITFSLLLGICHMISGFGIPMTVLANGVCDAGGAELLGLMMGIPVGLLSGRIKPGEPTLLEA